MSVADLSSRLLIGHVWHRRYKPTQHQLTYPVFMACINLDEIEDLAARVRLFGTRWWHWARFKPSDYFRGRHTDLKSAVIGEVNRLTEQSLKEHECSVMAVVNLRYLGLYFSPVNFYYVYDSQGNWNSIVAEVSNTPWNERHYYALKANENTVQCEKAFHVSPFNPVDQIYHWKLKPLEKQLAIHIECHRSEKEFDAALKMDSVPFTNRNLHKLLFKTPVQTLTIMFGIYWHAFILWKKGTPIYDHPKHDGM
jgi:hypothetical protein